MYVVKNIKMASPPFHGQWLPQPLLSSDPKKLISFNPFAAALQTSTAPPENAENTPHIDESTSFGVPLSKNEKSLAFGTDESVKIAPRLFTDVVQNCKY